MKIEDMHIRVEGVGHPLILLHGWGCDSTYMDVIYDYYKTKYKVCVLDLPGFGEHENIECAYTIFDYVIMLKNIVRVYDLANPILIAHSFGARIAFHYAALFPCRYIIATGAAGIKKKRNLWYYAKVYLYKCSKHVGRPLSMGSEDYKAASARMKQTLVHIVNDDCSEDITKIQCPILLVWGACDSATPLWMAHTIMDLNSNASLVVFEKDDHFAYMHQMHRFLQVCDIALKEIRV